MIDDEFRKRRPPACRLCTVPLPFYVEFDNPNQPNWSVGALEECASGCHRVLAEILVAMWATYDVEPPPRKRPSIF